MSSNSSCTCLSQNFKTEKACWSGSLVDLYFKSSSYSQCAAALEADLTLFKITEEQENECQGGGDGMNGATHKKLGFAYGDILLVVVGSVFICFCLFIFVLLCTAVSCCC
jgi:large-conductance mechanosensitive channel